MLFPEAFLALSYEFSEPTCGQIEVYLWVKLLRQLRMDHPRIATVSSLISGCQQKESGILVPLSEFAVPTAICIESREGNFSGGVAVPAGDHFQLVRPLTVDGGEVVVKRMLESLGDPAIARRFSGLQQAVADLEYPRYPSAMYTALRRLGYPVSDSFQSNIYRENWLNQPDIRSSEFYRD